MERLQPSRSLADQVYDAVVDEICSDRLPAGTHLVQEDLARQFGVSRQPVQQAMARLKADGMVEETGRRGLFVAALDPARMLHHYGIRAALDGYAARRAAERVLADAAAAQRIASRGAEVMTAGRNAVTAGDVPTLLHQDDAFHAMIYGASGNPLVAPAAEPHWRFLRRAMGDVLRKAETPQAIWDEHEGILAAIASGRPADAERLAVAHAERAASLLVAALGSTTAPDVPMRRAEP